MITIQLNAAPRDSPSARISGMDRRAATRQSTIADPRRSPTRAKRGAVSIGAGGLGGGSYTAPSTVVGRVTGRRCPYFQMYARGTRRKKNGAFSRTPRCPARTNPRLHAGVAALALVGLRPETLILAIRLGLCGPAGAWLLHGAALPLSGSSYTSTFIALVAIVRITGLTGILRAAIGSRAGVVRLVSHSTPPG